MRGIGSYIPPGIGSRFAVLVMTLIALTVAFMPVAVVYASTQTRAIVSNQQTTIQKGQAVKDVLILGHNVTVRGNVSEILVVIDGDIHLTSTAHAGVVVDLGGRIHQDSGARVKALYDAPLHTPFWNGALFGGMTFFLLWAGMLAVEIGLLLLAGFISYGLREQLREPLSHVERSVRYVGLMGLFISLAVAAVGALGAVTVIGLPITALIAIFYFIAGIIGFSVVSLWGGKLALRHSPTERAPWKKTVAGASLILAFSSIPFIGLLIFAVFWIIGIGAVSVWVSGMWRDRKHRMKEQHS